MRDSNYRAVATNKASLTITSSMYDRRALDVPSDKPLVNSLNYLTYLVSSSPKVRETLATDGGIERLIEILHECHNTTFNTQDTIFNTEQKVLTAWKWTLAFQCLVLVGTRGTEKIRQKVVQAGILPIIATVLDNYITLNGHLWKQAAPVSSSPPPSESTASGPAPVAAPSVEPPSQYHPEVFSLSSLQIPMNIGGESCDAARPVVAAEHLTCDDYDSLSVEQLLKLVGPTDSGYTHDIRRRYLIVNIIQKLRRQKELEIVDDRFVHPESEYDMDAHLHFLSDLYLEASGQVSHVDTTVVGGVGDSSQPAPAASAAKMVVRNFTETGVVIPRDDDIIWSLQLLAYISKYPYLKEALQNTHLIIDMSIRDKQLKLYLEKQMKMTMKKSMEIRMRPTLAPKSQKLRARRLQQQDGGGEVVEDEEFDLSVVEESDSDLEVDSSAKPPPVPEETVPSPASRLPALYDAITKAEAVDDEAARHFSLCQVTKQIDDAVYAESQQLKLKIMEKRRDTKRFLNKKWDYDTYQGFDVDDPEDQDESLVEYKRVNLFPLVEKFTFLSGTDMYYWSGVIMRNSCRRNDTRGGVRQCGNLECGRWESYPREFSKCRRCKRTKYCSRDCQIKAWSCHRNWCIPSTSSNGSTVTENSGATSN
ncbi:MYND-type zinc finger protein Mub1p [Diutina catenulata]